MADKFFDEEEQIESQEPEKIKLGEKEFTQDELNELVQLGEQTKEISEKYKTPMERVYPEYKKATQKVSDLERQINELQSKVTQPQVQQQPTYEQLNDEQKALVKRQLEELGYGEQSFRSIVREELAANQLLGDIDTLINDAQENGQPVTDAQSLLQHMAQTGIKNPYKAYKDMFETELDALKEKKIAEIKPTGMVTTNVSVAGAKQPAPVRVTKANLNSLVLQALNGE